MTGFSFLSLSLRYILSVNARIFVGMADKRKASAALLAAFIAQSAPQSLENIFEQSDKKVALNGMTPEEIEHLLNELS